MWGSVCKCGSRYCKVQTFCELPGAAVTRWHQREGLEQQTYRTRDPWIVLYHRSGGLEVQNQGVSRGSLLLKAEGSREKCFLPLPSFWKSLEIFGILWLAAASLQSLHPSSHGLLPVDLSSRGHLLTRTPVMLDVGPTLHRMPSS